MVADDVGRIFVTSSPNKLVIIDNASLAEIARANTGIAPDGAGWDPKDKIVGVPDQRDGAVSRSPTRDAAPERRSRSGPKRET